MANPLISLFEKTQKLLRTKTKPKKKVLRKKSAPKLELKKSESNPVLSPATCNEWEAGGTFNPGAWRDDDGNVHLVYRAIGADGVSRFGYAVGSKEDSFTRHTHPIFFIESPRRNARIAEYNPVMYPSGGSWGGCEDPRIVGIDDRLYVTFSAFDGWDFIRVAVSSISKADFLERKWKWSAPLFISPPGQVHKNWVLFPEKIRGKFAILHSISPKIQIDYINRLEDLALGIEKINSVFLHKEERDSWDTWPRGAGAPPVKTPEGWLVLYHATNKHERHKYKLGAMLLDLKDPKKIIARSPEAILCPDMWYENDAKPGVVYVCGAILADDMLHVYYGGGDKHICTARIPVQKLLSWLLKHGTEK